MNKSPFLILPLLLITSAISACNANGTSPLLGNQCDSRYMQPLVGRPSQSYIKFMSTLPKSVQDNSYYFGAKEAVGDDIPKGAMIVRVETDHVETVNDLANRKIIAISCNE